jgi:hypothetical protein
MADETIVNIPPEMQYKSQLIDALYGDPKMRPKLLQLVKDYAPNLRIPELDTTKEVLDALKPHLEEIGKFKTEAAKERAEIRAERDREKLMTKLSLTEEDMPAIDKLMKEGGVQHLETAAELHQHRQRAAAPRGIMPTPFTIGSDAATTKEYLRDPVGTARKRAYEQLAEMRR